MTPLRKYVLARCISMPQVIGLKETLGINNVTPKAAKKKLCMGVAIYWEECFSSSGYLTILAERQETKIICGY